MSSDLTCRLGKLALIQPQKLKPLSGYEHDSGLGLRDTKDGVLRGNLEADFELPRILQLSFCFLFQDGHTSFGV
jgi:hypothetical protein